MLGNLFRKGEKACLCTLTVQGDTVTATPKDLDSGLQPASFLLKEEWISFGGEAGSQLVVKNSEGATLYAERAEMQPLLERSGSRALRDKLKAENARVSNSTRLSMALFFGFFLSCGLFLGLVILGLNWGVDRVIDRIPITWEEQLGELVMKNDFGPRIEDSRVTEPIKKVIERIAAAQPDQPYRLTLHVIDNPQINAFAAPGGHIVVFSGLLDKTENPEELAGVLAHEFQHIVRRHGLKNMVHSVKWQVVASFLLGDIGSVQQVVLGRAPEFLSLSYGRSLEEEADIEGAKLLVRAQIDPQGMVDFFQILENNAGDLRVPELLSSHPETARRIKKLEAWIDEQEEQQYRPFQENWSDLKQGLANPVEREGSFSSEG